MKNQYWNLVLTGAFMLGVLWVALSFLSYVFNNNTVMNFINSIGGLGILIWALIFYGKKVAHLKDVDGVGFSYGQAFGFSILMLLLSGVIVGIGQWLLHNVVDPEFYAKVNKEATEAAVKMVGGKMDSRMIASMQEAQDKMKIIWWVIANSMGTMCLLGGFVALITSAVVRRKPQIF
ncbi:hypothetical protein BN938_1994 [Mucinivorans hirudinis]|uniref:DUF4199 domain-containing protein n=1 Tax=Mucinivorans hirudinis TaxID=1433126 RepID=A0A060R916_9BACT|nr:hypothetical protein BN938_1994 [Mucinivorans hirudinis]